MEPTNQTLPNITLYGYWRSSCSHRLQIALRLKQLPFRYQPVDLDRQQQREPWFLNLNPLGQVPVLQVDTEIWADSLVALETLEERFPTQGQRLLPTAPDARLKVRRVVNAIGTGLQPWLLPLQIRQCIDLNDEAIQALRLNHQGAALERLQQLISSSAGLFSVGDHVSMADVLLVAHLSGLQRLGLNLEPYPLLRQIYSRCLRLPAFGDAEPRHQHDGVVAADTERAPQADLPVAALNQILHYKEPDGALRAYLSSTANPPIPGLELVRQQTVAAFGEVASKVSALEVCLLLRWLAASRRCRRVLEIGVFTGSSSLALLDGMGPAGTLSAIDIDPTTTAVAQQAWQQLGLLDRVDFRLGDALQLLPALEPGFDLIYVDGANWEYEAYLDKALPLLAPGGLLVFDNVLWRGLVIDPDPADASAAGLARFNALLRRRHDLQSCVLHMGDGLALVSPADNG